MKTAFKIISTLGPQSLSAAFVNTCREHSQLYFRLNGSHLSAKRIQEYSDFIRSHTEGHESQIFLDLQGNKLRIGQMSPREMKLSPRAELVAKLTDASTGTTIPLPHPEIFRAASSGDILIFQDATVKMKVEETGQKYLRLRVLSGDSLRSGCGIHIQDKPLLPEALPANQKQQIEVADGNGFSHLALSYVRSPEEVLNLRKYCRGIDYSPRLIAKIEHPAALNRLEEIIDSADEIWFCRGDLGALIPLAGLGYWQDLVIQAARRKKKPVYVAGQVFHHLTTHPQPTRSEVVHFYHLQQQGVNGIVLSDETAIGQNPAAALGIIASLVTKS